MAKGKKCPKWVQSEEDILLKNVRNNVTNLTKAFKQTSLETQRSQSAVAAHWYANTSIKSGHCLFMTISGKHVAINRKNGKGKNSSYSIFKRVLKIFKLSD